MLLCIILSYFFDVDVSFGSRLIILIDRTNLKPFLLTFSVKMSFLWNFHIAVIHLHEKSDFWILQTMLEETIGCAHCQNIVTHLVLLWQSQIKWHRILILVNHEAEVLNAWNMFSFKSTNEDRVYRFRFCFSFLW